MLALSFDSFSRILSSAFAAALRDQGHASELFTDGMITLGAVIGSADGFVSPKMSPHTPTRGVVMPRCDRSRHALAAPHYRLALSLFCQNERRE
jgi:hypothetical protein